MTVTIRYANIPFIHRRSNFASTPNSQSEEPNGHDWHIEVKNNMSEDPRVVALEARVRDMAAALRQDDHKLLVTFKLPPGPSNLLGLLLSVELVTPEMIERRLEIATESKVAVHRLRKYLEPYDIKIESRRHLGYWLTPETKARVLQMIDGSGTSEVTPTPAASEEGRVAA